MMKPRGLVFCAVALLAALGSFHTPAEVRVFANKDAFALAISNAPRSSLDFEGFPQGPVSGTEFTNYGFVFRSPLEPPAGQLEVAPGEGFWPDQYLNVGKRPYASGDDGSNDSLDILVLGDWTALALEFVDTFFPGNGQTTVTFYGNASNVLVSTTSQNRNLAFLGVIADEPIRRVYVDEPADDGDDIGYDNFLLANPPPLAITRPTLAITNSPAGVVLRWSALFGDYALEVSDSLSTGEWMPVSDTPTYEDGEFRLTYSNEAETRFFRLRKLE
jgi:hypothetical protein